jgi:hypothetical protein
MISKKNEYSNNLIILFLLRIVKFLFRNLNLAWSFRVRPRVGTFEMLMYVVLVLKSERGMQIKENMMVKLDHVDLFA